VKTFYTLFYAKITPLQSLSFLPHGFDIFVCVCVCVCVCVLVCVGVCVCVCVYCSNSSVFKSVEEKVGGAYSSVKVRIYLQLHIMCKMIVI